MDDFLKTDRLILRPLELADAPAIQRIFPQWAVVRYLLNTVPWPYPPDGAVTFVRDNAIPKMEAGTGWFWSIRLRAKVDRMIGLINLRDDIDEHRGFWIDPVWQGHGFATEACAAVTDYWFGVLNKPVLRVGKAIGNTASRRISERSGMRVVATLERDYVGGRMRTEIWEITREEWAAANAAKAER